MPKLTFRSTYPVSPEELFEWHERPGSLQRLTPPWINAVVQESEGIQSGNRTVMRISKGPFKTEWVARHEQYVSGKQFIDVQESGPFQYWEHKHRFEAIGDGDSALIDQIDFQVKGVFGGNRYGVGIARRQIERAFAYRHRIIGQDLVLHQQYSPMKRRLRIGITGSSGFIGSELAAFFSSGGHRVVRIVRRRSDRFGDVYWDPATGEIDRAGLENLDAVIHLAGESVFAWKWSIAKKKRIMDSRVQGTRLLAKTLASLENPPSVLMTGSGVSIYGNQGSRAVSEASGLARGGFLSSVAKEWEAAAEAAVKEGIRTIFLRFGVVLSPRGGAMKRILPIFLAGFGGRFSLDEQWISWITLDDVLGAIYHLMMSSAAGPANVTSPFPITDGEFAESMARVTRRPAFMKVPPAIVRKVSGEIADELFFQSHRVHPEYLTHSEYQFMYPKLDGALRHILGRDPSQLDLSLIGDKWRQGSSGRIHRSTS